MTLREKIAVYCENYTRHKETDSVEEVKMFEGLKQAECQ